MSKKSFLLGALLGFFITMFITAGYLSISMLDGNSALNESYTDSYSDVSEKLEKIYGLIDRFYLFEDEMDKEEIIEGIYAGYVAYLGDPYTAYYSKEETKEMVEYMEGSYSGIGVMLTMDYNTNVVTITECYEGSGAAEAGVLANDVLIEVNGEDISGMDLSTISAKVKGEEGTKVKITVMREGEEEPLEFDITRKTLEYPSVEYEVIEENIGYIAISDFEGSSVSQFEEAYDDLMNQGVKGLIIDLRNNPGGLLYAVGEIANHFIPDNGLVVYTEDKYGNRQDLNAVTKEYCMVPLTVLVNGESASASEIFAGAVQSHGTGTIIGTTTFGKGLVQQFMELDDGSSVKITIEKYYTPSGEYIHGVGITPDIEVQLGDDVENPYDIPYEQDTQLHAAIEHINSETE